MKIVKRKWPRLDPISQSLLRKIQRLMYLVTGSENYLSLFIYYAARNYIDTYQDFNFSPKRNGEYWFLKNLGGKLKDPVVFDVGANIGEYADALSRFLDKPRIFAFEPGPNALVKLKSRNIKNIQIENIALSNKSGASKFKVYKRENSHLNTLVTQGTVANERGFDFIDVTIETGDAYCVAKEIRHIHFLKVDVEGAELNVFKGFENMFDSKAIDFVQFEYGYGSGEARTLFYDFFNFFNSKGYDLFKLRRSSLEPLTYHHELNDFRGGPNFVAIRKGIL